MTQTPHTNISQQNKQRTPGALWETYERFLDDFLEPQDFVNLTAADMGAYYATSRVSGFGESATSNKLTPLHVDIPDIQTDALGYTEADLLYWCLRDRSTLRLLNVVGPKGAGKSSLLHYLFRGLWSNSAAMQRKWCPLIVDLREVSNANDWSQTLSAIQSACQRQVRRLPDTLRARRRVTEYNQLHSLLAAIRPSASRTDLLNAIDSCASFAARLSRTLLLILDNCDHLTPSEASNVLAFARATTLRSDGVRAMIALRPFSHRSQLERNTHLSGITSYHVTIYPPNISEILRHRMSFLFSDGNPAIPPLRSHLATQSTPQSHSLHTVLSATVDLCLPDELVQQLTTQAFNANLRRLMTALRQFFRSPEFPLTDILHFISGDDNDRQRIRQAYLRRGETLPYVLLKGMMLGDWHRYRDPLNNDVAPILNLFSLGRPSPSSSRIILIKLLQIACDLNSQFSISVLDRASTVMGATREEFEWAVERMLAAGLLESPEHDEKLVCIASIRVTDTGRFYCTSMPADTEYIYNAVPDVFLTHSHWPRADPRLPGHLRGPQEYRLHAHSITDLISAICADEVAALHAAKQSSDVEIAALLARAPLLTTTLYTTASRFFERSAERRGKNSEINSCAQERLIWLQHILSREVTELEALQDTVREELTGLADQKTVAGAVGCDSILKVAYPSQLNAGRVESIQVALENDSNFESSPLDAWLFLDGVTIVGKEAPVKTLGTEVGNRTASWLVTTRGEPKPPQGLVLISQKGIPVGAVAINPTQNARCPSL